VPLELNSTDFAELVLEEENCTCRMVDVCAVKPLIRLGQWNNAEV
jgi:hypothetical protein